MNLKPTVVVILSRGTDTGQTENLNYDLERKAHSTYNKLYPFYNIVVLIDPS